MYIREVTSSRKNGPDAVYLQLVEGHRDGKTGKVKIQILHSFGRKDKLDLGQVQRLVNQLGGYLSPEDQPDLLSDIEITRSWDYGGPYLLDALWHELKLDRFFLGGCSKSLSGYYTPRGKESRENSKERFLLFPALMHRLPSGRTDSHLVPLGEHHVCPPL